MALSFIVLSITGVISYFTPYTRTTSTLHTIFGLVFIFGIGFHFKNNFRPIKIYLKGKSFLLILGAILLLTLGSYSQWQPFKAIMDYGSQQKTSYKQEVNISEYQLIKMNTNKELRLSIDLLKAEHYWHPQMAIWIEDEDENYVETLFVSKATAKGLFYGGRSKSNFKQFDAQKASTSNYRRVDALPVWSHRRGVQYSDGMYVPADTDSFPDAITGATIPDNFNLLTSVEKREKFRLKIEINVAFDDNEYYSEFDFPDDEVYHNGTGQLGQPSIVFEALIDLENEDNYYLMKLVGHGHQSGQTGKLFTDLSKLTTAKQIVERIVVGVHKK